jgi:two-component system chemotaxis response regulator CheB
MQSRQRDTSDGQDDQQGESHRGSATIAQDEAPSVVFGMPKEAIKLGAADRVMALDHIPAALIQAQTQ